MKIIKIAGGLLALILVLWVVLAPIGPLPGLFIGGSSAEAPMDWPDTASVHEIQLQVPGILPRVVIVWVVEFEGELYVFGSRSSGWVSMIGEGEAVKMRLGDQTYSLNASRVNEGWQPIYLAYLDKYRPDYPDLLSEFPSMEEADKAGAVFRLSRTQ
jgi:hypothetical protein